MSRRFASAIYDYGDTVPPAITAGGDKIRFSTWVNLRELTASSGFVFHMAQRDDTEGISLRYLPANDTFKIIVSTEDQGGTDRTVAKTLDNNDAVAADYSGQNRVHEHTHIAFDVEVTATDLTVRAWVNGIARGNNDVSATFNPTTIRFNPTPPNLYVAGYSSGAVVDNISGDVADLCMATGLWGPSQIADLQSKSAKDVIHDGSQSYASEPIIFNPQLHETEKDPYMPVGPTVSGVGTITRYLGPPISYSQVNPSVVIVGDTQHFANVDDYAAGTQYDTLGDHLKDYQGTLNARAILHVGDWADKMQDADLNGDGARVVSFMSKWVDVPTTLHPGGIPYSLTLGNHEYIGAGNGQRWLYQFASQVPNTLLERPWVLARMPETDFIDDRYTYIFEVDLGEMFNVIVIPWAATRNQVKWVVENASSHGRRRTILMYHNANASAIAWMTAVNFGSSASSSWDFEEGEPPQGTDSVTLWDMDHWWGDLRAINNIVAVFSGHIVPNFNGVTLAREFAPMDDGRRITRAIVNKQDASDGGEGCVSVMSYDEESGRALFETWWLMTGEKRTGLGSVVTIVLSEIGRVSERSNEGRPSREAEIAATSDVAAVI